MTDLAFWLGPVNVLLCLIGVLTRNPIIKAVVIAAQAVLFGVQVAAILVLISQ